MRTGILTIPLELRLQIYSYLHEPRLELDFCKAQTGIRLSNCSSKPRKSPLLTYMHKRKVACQWAREYGIHILATNVVLAQEFTDLVSRSSVLTFHCTKCLTRLLVHLRNDLGLKQPVFKNIRTRLNIAPERTMLSRASRHTLHGSRILEDAFASFQMAITRIYGAFSLVYDELEQSSLSDAERKWLIEQVRVIGLLTADRRMSEEDDMELDSHEHDDQAGRLLNNKDTKVLEPKEGDDHDDFRFNEHTWGRYETVRGVKELKRWNLQWEVGESSGESLKRIKRRIRTCNFSSVDEEWRTLSQDLLENLSDKRKRYLVGRDEIWLRVILP